MEEHNIKLTKGDKLVLDSYCQLVDGLSHYLGDGYEIVLHSLESYSHSVIKIINGFHTGRTVGAPITDLALAMLERIRSGSEDVGDVAYTTKNKKGDPLWSSTISIKGEQQRIIGLLCINFYLNTSMHDVIRKFFPQSQIGANATAIRQETFVDSADDLVETAVVLVREEVQRNPTVPTNQKNKEIIHRLEEKGIFSFKDAVVRVATILNISRNTVYLHLRNHDEL